MEMSARDGRKLRQETAVEGRKGGIITSTSTDEHKYPTSSTIPFPFASGPYACQAALMDAMLDTLKLVDENDECDHDPVVGTTRKEHKANIMMLESPTGTGKSLSLACASLAWLKYREQCDLNALTQPSKEDKLLADTGNKISTKVDSSSASARPNNKNKPDWLYDWTPPDQVAKEQEKKRQTKACLERAASARGALEKDLNSIRKQLKHQRLLDGYAYAASSSSNIGKQELIRKAREHIVKKAMIDARSKGRIKGCSIRRKSDVSVGKKRPRTTNNEDEDDSMYCLSAYHSDDENTNNKKFDYNSSDDDDTKSVKDGEGKQRFKSKVASLINGGNLDGSGENKLKYQHQVNKINSRSDDVDAMTVGGVTPGSGIRKIVYAARTHSQLSQFVGEIKRTKWGKANDVRVIALGGRRLLCGNREVTESRSGGRKRSEAIITEKCLDIQKSSKLSCPLLTKDDYAIPTLSMHMLAEPSDIEDLAGLGEASKTCSYYASRESIKAAEVVVVPYNTLLSKSARDAVGLSLKKSLVIIDESHNIPEALRSLSSCTMTASAIDGAMIQLTNYVKKYSSRLAGRNIFYLGQIRRFLTSSAKYLRSGRNRNSGVKMNKEMVTATDLLFTLKLDNLNLFNILRYLERSGLSQKLHGFTNASAEYKSIEVDTSPNFVSKHISQMSVVETFLRCLTSSQQEGRVIIEIPEEGANKVDTGSRDSVQSIANFRYLLLDPSTEFKNIRQEAHAIVLAGGTLRPFTHIATELLGSDKELVKKTNEVEKSISCSNDNTAQSAISQSSSEVQPSSPLKTSGIKEIEPTSSNRSPTTLNSVPKIISLQSPKIGTLRTDSKTSSNIDVGAINKKLFVGKCTRVEPRFDIKDYDADEDESDAEESDIPADKIKCFVCSSGHAEDDNDVLMCDGKGCFRAMHMKCRLPNVTQATLDQDESGTFFCPFCTCFATALHYIETEFYADERGLKDDDEEQDNTHQDHSSNKSWEQAEEVFPESVEEFEVAEKWMEGLDDDRSSRIISTCLGIEVAGEETSAAQGAGAEIYDDHEEDDESDTDFCSQSRKEDNESISGSDDESSGVNWNIESSELSELPPSQIGSESEDDSQEDDGKKIRRSRRRLGKDNEIQPGKKIDGGTLDTSNIVRGKRRRTSVDYNKLNDAMFGEGGAIRATKDIDDEEDYHFVTKAEPTDGDSNCSSDSDEDCSKSSGSSDGNNSLGNSSTSKTSKGLG